MCAKKRKVSEWRKGFAEGETIQRVRPTESKKYILNPHKGTTTFQRFNGDPIYRGNKWSDKIGPIEFPSFKGSLNNPRYPDTTISYCRWTWMVIEPTLNGYRWDIIDGALNAAKQRGQTLQVRLQPYIHSHRPAWYESHGGTLNGNDIDHNNPVYLKYWGKLIRAFATRYDGHPQLESFDVAYGGDFGEGGGNTSPENAAKLIDIYFKSFKKTQLVTMLGTDGCRYAFEKFNRPIGWRIDCIGDMRADGWGDVPDHLAWTHMLDVYPKSLHTIGNVKDAWKTSPITMETCWTVGHWKKMGWDIDFIIEQILMYKASVFMPKSCYIPSAWQNKIEEMNKRLGYRFVMRQLTMPLEASPKTRIPITVFLDNLGVAPIYRPYKYAYRFRQGKKSYIVKSTQDIRKWMPGSVWFEEKIKIPAELKKGVVNIDIGIIDQKSNTATVRFAIEETSDDKWHPVASMDII